MHHLRRSTQATQCIQTTRQLDLRHFPQVLAFQRIGAALGELMAEALEHDGGFVVHAAEPARVMADEQLAAQFPAREGDALSVKQIISHE